jgi:putative membrane protein
MIEHYRDHAANERTFLAWVRTSITVMVLGFIVEKFEIFLASLTDLLTDKGQQIGPSTAAEYVSLALVTLGVLVIVAGVIRFFHIKAGLDAANGIRYHGTLLALVLTFPLVAFGIYLILYLAHII